ncbi:MAG: hypothetical protein VW258_10505 [Thalassolituus sp.]
MTCVLIASLALAPASFAAREGYSYFGVGTDYIAYSERNDNLLNTGITLASGSDIAATTQRGGGYVGHESGWGFYIASEATLGNNVNDESWTLNGTRVQEDSFSFRRSELTVLVAYDFTQRQSVLFGGATHDTSFNRFDWHAVEQDEFIISLPDGTVSEDVFKLYGLIGYETGTLFLNEHDSRLNWQLRMLAGIPLFSQTLNTESAVDTITGGFDGYLLEVDALLGYRLTSHLLLGLSLKYSIEYQEEIQSDFINESQQRVKRTLPENELSLFQPTLNMYWSF